MNTKHTRNGTFPAHVTAATQPAGIGLQTDYHTHTTFSPDGSSTPDAMCQRALDLGYDTIAFTEHAEWHNEMDGFPRLAEYATAVADCRARFAPQGLTVLTGVELGNPHEYEREAEQLLMTHPFDVRIASLHWLYGENIHLDACFEGINPQEVYADYFTELGNMASRIDADIIAHFDRVLLRGTLRGAQPDLVRLESVIRDALVTVAWRGMALELNTRYLRSNPGWLAALRTMLGWFRAEGGERIVVNSDAHHIDQIGLNADLALQLLTAAGFDAPARLPVRTPMAAD